MDNQEKTPQADPGNVQTSQGNNNTAPLTESINQTNPITESSNQTNNQPNLGEFKQNSPDKLVNSANVEKSSDHQIKTDNQQDNINFDSYTPDFSNQENKSANQSGDTNNSKADEKSSRVGTIITIILIIIIVVGIWQTNKNSNNKENNTNDNVKVVVDSTKETGNVTIVDGDNIENGNSNISGETVKIVAYYNKRGTGECENVASLERTVEKKYESNVINTVRGLLTALSKDEISQGWLTSIPAGTYIKSVTIKDGVAKAVFSSSLKNVAGSCRMLAIRSQIEKTLLQFPYIKSVNICIDNNCNQAEVLQP